MYPTTPLLLLLRSIILHKRLLHVVCLHLPLPITCLSLTSSPNPPTSHKYPNSTIQTQTIPATPQPQNHLTITPPNPQPHSYQTFPPTSSKSQVPRLAVLGHY